MLEKVDPLRASLLQSQKARTKNKIVTKEI